MQFRRPICLTASSMTRFERANRPIYAARTHRSIAVHSPAWEQGELVGNAISLFCELSAAVNYLNALAVTAVRINCFPSKVTPSKEQLLKPLTRGPFFIGSPHLPSPSTFVDRN